MSSDLPPRSSEPLPDQPSADRLDSWKDIAAYLKRDVSTVQRWEKRERMPVHRHVHDKQGTVYAFRSELDSWWRGRANSLAEYEASRESGTSPPPPEQTTVHQQAMWTRPRLAFAGVVAVGVAVAIGVLLPFGSGEEGSGVSARDAVLHARYLSVRTTDGDNRAAIAQLERAIALDSGYAPAYSELAAALVVRLAYVTPEESRELEQKAFAAAEKALSLDPSLPGAYIARGDLLWSHSHRFAHERAVQEFRRALERNPKSDQAHQRLARVFVHAGFFDEALSHAATALAINPSNAQALNSRAQATLWMGRDEDALAILSSIPGPVLPELVDANTAFALFRLGRRDEAWTQLTKALRDRPVDASGSLPAMQALLLADSEPGKAEELMKGVEGRKPVNPAHHAAYFAAAASARMGRAREAVRWLREAADTGFPCYPLFARDPNLDRIRRDKDFMAFMTEMEKRSAALRKALFAVEGGRS